MFIVKSVMAMLEQKKKAVILSAWDLKKYFDSKALKNVMGELFRSNIKGKLHRLIFKQNELIKICVDPPVV